MKHKPTKLPHDSDSLQKIKLLPVTFYHHSTKYGGLEEGLNLQIHTRLVDFHQLDLTSFCFPAYDYFKNTWIIISTKDSCEINTQRIINSVHHGRGWM